MRRKIGWLPIAFVLAGHTRSTIEALALIFARRDARPAQ
jgi:hypothetical protein